MKRTSKNTSAKTAADCRTVTFSTDHTTDNTLSSTLCTPNMEHEPDSASPPLSLSEYRGILNVPQELLIKILSSASIPVSERVRASRTCKAFYDVLSGPHAFSNVKKLPGPELRYEQFDKILDSERDTRSAMVKRLRSSVTSLDLDLSETPMLSEQLMFVSKFQNLTTLEISLIGNVEYFDVRSLPVQPDKLQVSTLLVKVTRDQSKSLANVLECILNFSAVSDLMVLCDIDKGTPLIDLRPLLERDFNNLRKIDLRHCALGNLDIESLGELFMRNVSLTHIDLGHYDRRIKPLAEQTLFLSALCQLNLQHLSLCPGMELRNDRWLTDLAANSGETLESLAFRPATNHALDSIQQQQFKKLTYLQLLFRPQSLTSVIAFIKGRPAGMPKLRLECVVDRASRRNNETKEQEEELRSLISSESNTVDSTNCNLIF